MPTPKPLPVVLKADVHQELETLVRRHTTPQQIALRARIVLLASAGNNNQQIARLLGVGDERSDIGASTGPRVKRFLWKI